MHNACKKATPHINDILGHGGRSSLVHTTRTAWVGAVRCAWVWAATV